MLQLSKRAFFLGHPVFVSVEFYANWCQTCVEFQPKFKLMARQLNSLGVATAQVFFLARTKLSKNATNKTFRQKFVCNNQN